MFRPWCGTTRRGLGAALLLAPLAVFAAACTGYAPVPVFEPYVENPPRGPELRLGRVEDQRAWERRAGHGYVHSVLGNDLSNPRLLERIVGRYQDKGGTYTANALLYEGRTVAQIAGEVVTRGFRESGFRVLERGDPGYDQAPEIVVVVRRFWTRMDTERIGVLWDFKAEFWIRAPTPPFEEGGWVCTNRTIGRGGRIEGIWSTIIGRGMEQIVEKLRYALLTRSLGLFC